MAAIGLAVVCSASGCGSARDGGEYIVFASDRSGDGRTHLWWIDATGDPDSLQQITDGDFHDGSPRVSPDGRLLAFSRAPGVDASDTRIWIRSLVTGVESQLSGVDNPNTADWSPFWSPDGRSVGFTRSERLNMGRAGGSWLMAARLGSLVPPLQAASEMALIADDGTNNRHGAWHPTGRDLLFNREVGGRNPLAVFRLDADGAVRELIPHECCGAYYPTYSPDGLRIAYMSFQHSDAGDLYVANADGSQRTRVTCESGVDYYAWAPDGAALVLTRTGVRPVGFWRAAVPSLGAQCSTPVPVGPPGLRATQPDWFGLQG